MAIIKCPECGKEISDKADVCIHCGFPLTHILPEQDPAAESAFESPAENGSSEKRPEGKMKKPFKKPLLLGIILGGILLIAAVAFLIIRSRNIISNTPKEASNLPVSVSIEGVLYDGVFSGQELQGVPYGECSYTFGDGTKKWTFIGTIDERGNLTGTVDKMPIVVNAGFGDAKAVYSGAITDNVPSDTIEVVDLPYKYEYDTVTYSGTFSGTTFESLPNGNGEFSGSNASDYLNYSGKWEQGKMGESGVLKSNHVTIHFPDLDRTGKYEGNIVNGVLEGEGIFSATTDAGVNYTYKGSFLNGLFDGQGSQIYDDETWSPHIGKFTKGDFTPSYTEALNSLGQKKTCSFDISDAKLSFIEKNTKLFTQGSQSDVSGYINSDFKIADFAKNPKTDSSDIVKISMRIFQVVEEELWGYDFTTVLGYKGNYTYYCLYFGKSDKLAENKSVTLYAMPLDYSTYRGSTGGDYWAAFCLISSIG